VPRLWGLRAIAVCALAGVLFAGVLARGPAALAQANRVREVAVEGAQRIEAATIRTYMKIAPGDPFDEGRIDESLKALFGTGLFADVVIRREGDVLLVRVVENPIINRLAFEGNKRVGDDILRNEVQLRPRQVYTRAKVQTDVQRLLQIYRASGRFAATVEPKVIQLEQNRVDLVFEISEGAATEIGRIRFIGNARFSDGRLRDVISTKETAWYRFLSTDDTYVPERLAVDQSQLQAFYLARGYADFRVTSAVAELSPARDSFFITFTVDEGELYNFGAVDIRSDIKAVDVESLRGLIVTKQDTVYNADTVEKTVQALTFELGRLGYAFVDVRPDPARDPANRTVGVTYVINESPRVYVERVNITGNVRTLDEVIRREFRISEGDAFNTAKLRRTRTRVRGLDYFEKVEIRESKGSAPDRVIIDAEVEEKSTGELSFGVGISTTDTAVADASIRERNLLGRGQDLRLGLTLSPKRQQIDLGFTEPYFLDRELAAGFDIFRRRADLQDRSGYLQVTDGLTLRATYPITEALAHQVAYRLRRDSIEDVSPLAALAVQRRAGTTTTSLLGHVLAYDQRDDRIEPTAGYFTRFGQDFAGLGGTEKFLRHSLEYTHYFPLFSNVVLSGEGVVGHIVGIDDQVNIASRFFLGGDSFRGFKPGGVGPRDRLTGDSLGGNVYYTATAQAQFPLGLPKELAIKGRVFTIAGSLFDIDENDPNIQDENSVRVSAGFGISWRSPFGPIRVDIAKALVSEPFDEAELFRFSFGTRF
jgi:outer membrane protein insertion porin family